MYTATVIKSGNSYALRIPKRLADDAKLEIGQKVSIPIPQQVQTQPPTDNSAFLEALEDLQRVVVENKKRGTGLGMIKDPVAWQQEIRKDRPLPGRGDDDTPRL